MTQVSTLQAEPFEFSYHPQLPRRGTVLVVEDRKDMRDGLVQLLTLHGFTAVGAEDGVAALGCLAVDPDGIALILLDLLLPGPLSGVDVRERQLADAELSMIPAVVVSACESTDILTERLHPVEWLEKPFRGHQLLAIVERYVVPQ